MNTLTNKHIIVGITGSIAAYKSAELVRRLRDAGAQVRVVMTKGSKEFITPLTLQALSGHPVHDDLFDPQAEAAMGHIELARWADALIIAPATADCLAKLAHGHASDLLSTLYLATTAKIIVAPAMNQQMWRNEATQTNVQLLKSRNIYFSGPAEGEQACDDIGPGRMSEPLDIIRDIANLFSTNELNGKKILITVGPTQEPLDPIRFLSNHSSGKMGYAMAQAALGAGAEVTLISGPTALNKPHDLFCIGVTTAQEMREAVIEQISSADIFIAAAAVSDYRSQEIQPQKIKKSSQELSITLLRNPDILAEAAALPNRPYTIGFAAETEQLIPNAREKLKNKKLDMVIANQVGEGDTGFISDMNACTVLWQDKEKGEECMEFSLRRKDQLARDLMSLISKRQSNAKHSS